MQEGEGWGILWWALVEHGKRNARFMPLLPCDFEL